MAELVPLTFSWGRYTHYSDRSHDFSVTIPRCYKDVYVNSFFPRTARLWNSLPIECFPLTCDLSGFKSRIKRHLLTVGFSKQSLCPLIFLCFFFLVTACLVVAVQPCMEWISIKNWKKDILKVTTHLAQITITAFWKYMKISLYTWNRFWVQKFALRH